MDGLWTLYLDQVVGRQPSLRFASRLPARRATGRPHPAAVSLRARPDPAPVTPVEAIHAWLPEFAALRRDLHAHPECGFEVHRTAALVAEKLASWGIEVHRGIGRTGVVGVLRNGPGRRIGLRADMDALDMPEQNRFAHASRVPGRMHACGHDGHTAMLLAAARYLAETRAFRGTVHLIFQPAEEGQGGARAMLADGLFERFPCDHLYGLHNWPGLPVGHFAIGAGPVMAGCAFFDLHIEGAGGHGARPESTVDPVVCGAQIVAALQTVVARNLPPQEAAVLSVTGFNAGAAYNIIPQRVSLRGTVRAFTGATMALVEGRIRSLAAGIAAGFGARAELSFREVTAPVVNAEAPAACIAAAAAGLVGAAQVDRGLPPNVIGEDFSYMLDEVPGAYILVGNGTGDAGGAELHSPGYDFNDDAIPYGAGLLAATVERELALGR